MLTPHTTNNFKEVLTNKYFPGVQKSHHQMLFYHFVFQLTYYFPTASVKIMTSYFFAGLQFRHLPSSSSQFLGLKEFYATTKPQTLFFKWVKLFCLHFLEKKSIYNSLSLGLKKMYQQNLFFGLLWAGSHVFGRENRNELRARGWKGLPWDASILLIQRYCYREHTTIDSCLDWEPQHSI